jgi:hypothetical protein
MVATYRYPGGCSGGDFHTCGGIIQDKVQTRCHQLSSREQAIHPGTLDEESLNFVKASLAAKLAAIKKRGPGPSLLPTRSGSLAVYRAASSFNTSHFLQLPPAYCSLSLPTTTCQCRVSISQPFPLLFF